jgi:uncharacterized membrane protein YqgA involved in biofilm formation
MAVAALLVLTFAAFGFWWFLLLVIALIIGAVVGRVIEGRLDISGLVDAVSGKRRSS